MPSDFDSFTHSSEGGVSTSVRVAELEASRAKLDQIEQRFALGHAVDFNDFPYIPKTRPLESSAGGEKLLALFESRMDKFLHRFETFCCLNEKLKKISVLPKDCESPSDPYWENWWLPGLDACILYGMVATEAPKIYLEVGSGNSTKFVRRAISDFGLDTKIISIDPNPTAEVDRICDEVIRRNCEDVDVSIFQRLSCNDILFIDNSHRSFQNSDVTVFFTEILPSLRTGVIYGVHDVFLPWDYPKDWNSRFYNEQYLLMSYLLGGAGGDDIYLPGHFVYKDARFSHLINRLFVASRHIDWLTGSFWLERA
ncbi:hypothetical protein FHR71_004163 [Methylobacterium sp. RAS18]|uniref:class I SAM-dependent methyltransferase n=1 Tax=Methylorubrum extorquens TaxID=408 RepID=UPI001838F9B6|nr:class I SAM-dependent methyltransferase [Methylorubrum extorquens]MBA9070397.1 hypothetical protein [Methylobacterium sp. RAS18]UYW24988.1 class I SAM-dependent methyltransferase [Methylorubrum extorquens]